MVPPENKTSKPAGNLVASPAGLEPNEVRQQRRNDYNRLVRTARLKSLIMEKAEFKVSPESIGVDKNLLSRDLSAKIELLSSGADDGTCIVNVIWELKYSYKRKSIVRSAASYIVSYDGMRDFSEEVIRIYADTNAKGAVYAYFRALYAHLDWSANLGSPPLPVVQLQAKV